MDQTLKKICGLLQSQDNLRRCGAALVLAELAPKNAAVVKALGETIAESDATLRDCLLTALQAIGSPAAAPYVIPLLDSEEVAVRLRVAAIVATAGAGIVPDIKRQLEQAPRRRKMTLIDVLGRIHTTDAFQLMLDQLFDPDLDVARQVCEVGRRYTADQSTAGKLKLHKHVVRFMNSPKVKDRERILASCLLLLGGIQQPEARSILLKYATPKNSPYLRRHSLISLRRLSHTKASAAAVLSKLLPYLDGPDPDIVRNVIDVLDRLSPVLGDEQLRKFLKSKHGQVRAFALKQLSEADSVPNNRLLLKQLTHEEGDVRELAARALARNKKAVGPLLDALAAEKNVEAAWQLARILKAHASDIDKKSITRLRTLITRELVADSPRSASLMYLLQNIDPAAAQAILLDAGMQHRHAKRWKQAVDCLRRLLHTAAFDNEVSYALSVSDLKCSAKELAPNFRAECHALRGFRSLLRTPTFKLMDKLKKDKALDSIDLYYVGFHFREEPIVPDFGEDLLRHVAKAWPRSKEARAVRNMLKSVRAMEKADVPAKKKTATSVKRKKTKK